jgi:hypothetical protein
MRSISAFVLAVTAVTCVPRATAQTPPWDLFEDPVTGTVCGVVNAANVELVVLHDTGQLVVITGLDLVLADTFVDADLNVFFQGDPVGFLDYYEDADGLASLWWISATGFLVGVDELNSTPYVSTALPVDFSNVACDPCDLWDNLDDCPLVFIDGDGDGVDDRDDLCPDTPADQAVGDDGCPLDDNTPFVFSCGSLGGTTLGLMICGLLGLKLTQRRM